MGKIVSEKNGTRKFERIGRWTALDYTIISRSSKFAKYADNYNSDDIKLNITGFKHYNEYRPFNRFKPITEPVKLSDLCKIVMKDEEDNLWLEVSPDREKVRLYKEVVE